MSLKDQIPDDIKMALKEKNTLKLNVLRMLQAAIKNKEIEVREQLSDEQFIQVVSSEVKKRRDAVEEFEKVDRNDAAENERKEIEVLMKYMPEQISEGEIRKKVTETIKKLAASGSNDLGSVMKAVMSELKGKAEGKLVNKIAREELEKVQENQN